MTLEDDLFQYLRPRKDQLKAYGFREDNNIYTLTKPFYGGSFLAVISIHGRKVMGKVIDTETEEEYVQIHLPSPAGSFSASVREAYLKILEDSAGTCFEPSPFLSEQAERIADIIHDLYGDVPEHVFKRFPDYAVFRHGGRWYALIMRLKENELYQGSPALEIIDLKADPETIPHLLEMKGIFPGRHMNASHWISAVLDDTLSDDFLSDLLKKSHDLVTNKKKGKAGVWLVPANPEYYDLAGAFQKNNGITLWKQSTAVKPGDIVYMYVGKPYSAILYRTKAIWTDIPSPYKDTHIRMDTLMRLQLLHEYDHDAFTLDKISRYGVKTVRGPRSVPDDLLQLLEEAAGIRK